VQARWIASQPFWQGQNPVKTVAGKLKGLFIRGNFPRMNSQGLAILNFRLASIDKRGDPFVAVVNYLEAFFSPTGNNGLTAFTIDFNIDATNIHTLEKHETAVNSIVQQLCRFVHIPLVC
jgi:hypothetical protein